MDTLTAVAMTNQAGTYISSFGQETSSGVPLIDYEELNAVEEVALRYAGTYPTSAICLKCGQVHDGKSAALQYVPTFTDLQENRSTFTEVRTLHGFRYIEIYGIRLTAIFFFTSSVSLLSIPTVTSSPAPVLALGRPPCQSVVALEESYLHAARQAAAAYPEWGQKRAPATRYRPRRSPDSGGMWNGSSPSPPNASLTSTAAVAAGNQGCDTRCWQASAAR